MTALLLLAALECTHPARLPASFTPCDTATIAVAEEPAYRWMIRRRRIISLVWQDTIRWTPHAEDVPGGTVRLPLAIPGYGAWVFEVAAMDSAGNYRFCSNPVVRFR